MLFVSFSPVVRFYSNLYCNVFFYCSTYVLFVIGAIQIRDDDDDDRLIPDRVLVTKCKILL